MQLHSRGRLAEAAAAYQNVLEQHPAHTDAMHLLGVVLIQSGQPDSGGQLIRNSLQIDPRQPAAWSNLGNAELTAARPREALVCHDQALALSPGFALAHNGRGRALLALGQLQEALQSFGRALDLQPGLFQAGASQAETLVKLGRFDDALVAVEKLLATHPNQPAVHVIRGAANCKLGRFSDGLANAERALGVAPQNLEARYLRCSALIALGSFAEALQETTGGAGYQHDDAQLEYYAGTALQALGREPEAVAAYERAIRYRDVFPDANFDLGILYLRLRQFEDAARAFERVFEVEPERDFLRGTRLHARLQICNWDDYEIEVSAVIAGVKAGKRTDLPLSFMSICGDAGLQHKCTQAYVAAQWLPSPMPATRANRLPGPKRIAYLSADFLEHPVAYLLAGVIEAHDRNRVESIGVALRCDERSPTYRRLRSGFDRFIDAAGMSDETIAQLLQELDVDILVDLMGYTAGARPGILARRPAKVQVGYLGYPGTLCAPYIDYLVADSVVIPAAGQEHYIEPVIRLPGCYLPNDLHRQIGIAPTRAQAGLPEQGLVFCAFTHGHKINPPLFDVWAQLLREVPHSVLWLRSMGAASLSNLRLEAQRRGIDPARLVPAIHVPDIADHLARLGLADLCLDTFPYNSHSTACDALWAGVPVLTCTGHSMASRVAASVLTAAGLEDFITCDFEQYAARGLELAALPERLQQARQRLREQRDHLVLFDTRAYTRAYEDALLSL